MADEKMISAQKNYVTLCSMLDDNNWHYEKDEAKLKIKCSAQGDDLPMDIIIRIDPDRQLVILMSHLPFVVSEDKRVDAAIATSVINYKVVDGSFDFDIEDGHMFFRMTSSYVGSELSKEVFFYMLMCSFQTIDDYNDKLLMLAKNMLSLEDFINNEMK